MTRPSSPVAGEPLQPICRHIFANKHNLARKVVGIFAIAATFTVIMPAILAGETAASLRSTIGFFLFLTLLLWLVALVLTLVGRRILAIDGEGVWLTRGLSPSSRPWRASHRRACRPAPEGRRRWPGRR